MTYEIKRNEQFNSLEIYFSGKPAEEIRTALNGLKFRWNPKKSCWYGFTDVEELKKIIGASENDTLVVPGILQVTDGDPLYSGWQGGNNKCWHSVDELKKNLSADFKKAHIKATIRKRNSGYLTAIAVTVTINRDDIKSFEEYTNCDTEDKRRSYECLMHNVECGYQVRRSLLEILKGESFKKFSLVLDIVDSYNRDTTNSMIDYFDRDIYDDFYVKVV